MRIINLLIAILILSLSITSCSSFGPTAKNNTPPEKTDSDLPPEPLEVTQEAIDYALVQAKFFRDSVNDINSLYEHSEYFSFLITRVYSLYQKQVLTIKDVSQNDWYKQYLIPSEYMEKASSLYLGIDKALPDVFYNQTDYNYQKTENAFLFSPYSPPMFVTECTNATINNDETINITIRISLIEEESALCENTYVYKIVSDETWGTIYQLISVTSEKSEDLTTDNPDIPYIPYRGECSVHGDDYHTVPAIFINYLGVQDDMNVWFSAKDTPSEEGCLWPNKNIYEFIHRYNLPKSVFIEEYNAGRACGLHRDYPIDLLFDGTADEVEEYYRKNDQKRALDSIKWKNFREIKSDISFIVRDKIEKSLSVNDYSIIQLIKYAEITVEELRSMISDQAERRGTESVYSMCFDYDYSMMSLSKEDAEKLTLDHSVFFSDCLFCGQTPYETRYERDKAVRKYN